MEAFKSRHKLRPVELARLFGVSVETVHAWLSGRSEPTAATRRLLDVYTRLESASPVLFDCLVRQSRVPAQRPGPKKGSTRIQLYRRPSKPKGEPGDLSALKKLVDFEF